LFRDLRVSAARIGVFGRPSYVRANVLDGVRFFLHRSGRMGIFVVSGIPDLGEGSAIERRLLSAECDISFNAHVRRADHGVRITDSGLVAAATLFCERVPKPPKLSQAFR
jgi:hypothetical protein